ncbi:hypothetical protein NQD34_008921 [Periophthalmus magnuspinnatus]|nr:hypothetical protein NQD34_008921 [Periophthalmus magnuspinnatus]
MASGITRSQSCGALVDVHSLSSSDRNVGLLDAKSMFAAGMSNAEGEKSSDSVSFPKNRQQLEEKGQVSGTDSDESDIQLIDLYEYRKTRREELTAPRSKGKARRQKKKGKNCKVKVDARKGGVISVSSLCAEHRTLRGGPAVLRTSGEGPRRTTCISVPECWTQAAAEDGGPVLQGESRLE